MYGFFCAAFAVAIAVAQLPIRPPREDQSIVSSSRRYVPQVASPFLSQRYVSTKGSDSSGDGSYINPFASLQRAQAAVRELLQNQTGDIFVYFRSGLYNLSSTASFGLSDVGSYTVHYAAWPADNAPVTLCSLQAHGTPHHSMASLSAPPMPVHLAPALLVDCSCSACRL